jgi:N-acetylneuraminate synthase
VLLDRVAATRKPVIVSTGMASLDEIGEAVARLEAGGCEQIALLRCTSAYPAPPSSLDLRSIPDLLDRFHTAVGLSDHTRGSACAVAAVALGASLVEKHFIARRSDGGPDASFSCEPDELAELVGQVRTAHAALGSVRYGPTPEESASLPLRRSLYVVRDVAPGEVYTRENLRSVRPGLGLPTRHLAEVLGRRAARAVAAGTPLSWDLLQ